MKNHTRSLDPFLTVEQLAKYLNINKFTVYRLLAQKQLPGFKVGNQWRFKKETIEAWLMKNLKKSRSRVR
jgi:excisionase family DNA binding protein